MVKSAGVFVPDICHCSLHRLGWQVQAGQGLKVECWQLRLDVVREQQLAKLPDLAANWEACAMSQKALSDSFAAGSVEVAH